MNPEILAMAQPYEYQPLNTPSTIGLIKIHPYLIDGSVACILHDFEQAQAPSYIALSYLWGDPKPTGKIQLGEHLNMTHVHPLHENLLQFLICKWKQNDFNLFFWTDSLCLNQADIDEKSQQVPRMRKIYEGAQEVSVWLGHDDVRERKLRAICNLHCALKNQHQFECGENLQQLERKARKATYHLLLLPYWTRVWIVQEVALARSARVACGSESLDLDDFDRMIRRTGGGASYFYFSVYELRKKGGQRPLWRLLKSFHRARCSRPVDGLYGLLGLANER